MRAWSKSKLHGNEGKYRQDDDCAVAEVDLRQLRGDVMDMIVQFLRWDRAATERGCYGVILPILYVVALTSDRLGFVFTRKLIGPHLP